MRFVFQEIFNAFSVTGAELNPGCSTRMNAQRTKAFTLHPATDA